MSWLPFFSFHFILAWLAVQTKVKWKRKLMTWEHPTKKMYRKKFVCRVHVVRYFHNSILSSFRHENDSGAKSVRWQSGSFWADVFVQGVKAYRWLSFCRCAILWDDLWAEANGSRCGLWYLNVHKIWTYETSMTIQSSVKWTFDRGGKTILRVLPASTHRVV